MLRPVGPKSFSRPPVKPLVKQPVRPQQFKVSGGGQVPVHATPSNPGFARVDGHVVSTKTPETPEIAGK